MRFFGTVGRAATILRGMEDMSAPGQRPERVEIEREIADALRSLSEVSARLGHAFARRHALHETDLRALMLIYRADVEDRPLSTSQLAQALGLTSAGGTYLVERLVGSGHIRREAHRTDRRKILLRYAEAGLTVARGFFGPLAQRNTQALARHDDAALRTALEVLRDVLASLDGYRDSLQGE